MELRNLVTFIHVAELGSFTKAAEQLGYSQSTISFQIKQLEQELHEAVRESKFEKAAQLRDKMQRMAAKPSEGRRARAVTGADVAWAVSMRTGIPAGRLSQTRRQMLLNLEQTLNTELIGQEAAVKQVCSVIRRGLSGVRDENRPVATLLLTGPTGVGKTDYSIELAKEYSSPIINCDSRQIYKEMNIGTASPSPEQLEAVRHYFIHTHSVTQY